MKSLYKDRLIEITDREIVFRCYYFPFGTGRKVPLEQIAAIEIRPPSLHNGSWRIWGTGDFGTWFPLDIRRPGRDAIFIASLRGASMRIGFTVEDSTTVAGVLEELGVSTESSN